MPVVLKKMKTRDESIDVLRWLALTGIIMVHSEPSMFWSQLRSFDVPLMVILSALCFANSKGIVDKKQYYIKRFVRLVIPAWIFLISYFSISLIIGCDIELKKVIMCFTLTTSWYLWIIRILVVMALLAPFLICTKKMTKNQLLFLCMFLLGGSEVLALVSDYYYYVVLIMFIPYTSYYIIGINLNRFSGDKIEKTGLLFLALFVIIAATLYYQTGEFILTGDYKYPPRLYYTSYALGFSAILWRYRVRIVDFLKKTKIKNFALFVGSHTFWIYLWHIPIVDNMVSRYDSITCFFTTYFVSIILTYLQSLIVGKICRCVNNEESSKYLKMIFEG